MTNQPDKLETFLLALEESAGDLKRWVEMARQDAYYGRPILRHCDAVNGELAVIRDLLRKISMHGTPELWTGQE